MIKLIGCISLLPLIAGALGATIPVIESVVPDSAMPGDILVVHGENFPGAAGEISLYVGPVEAEVTFASSERLEARLPSYLSNGKILATFPDKTSAVSEQIFHALLEEPGTLTSRSFAPNRGMFPPTDEKKPFDLPIPDSSGAPGPSQGVMMADLNRDGRPDLVAGNWNHSELIVFENVHEEGDLLPESFARVGSYSFDGRPQGTATGDLNGDGWLDLVMLAGWGDEGVNLFENTTTVTSSLGLTLRGLRRIESSLPETSTVFITDFDGDGMMDVFVGGGTLKVLRATTQADQIDPANYTVHSLAMPARMAALADFDGDGRPDIVGAPYNGSLYFLQNTSTAGGPAVAPPVALNTNGLPISAVSAGDLDGDGRPDVIAGYGSRIFLFENTSSEEGISFAEPISMQVSTSSMQLLNVGATDVSGDGEADLWIADRYNGMMLGQNLGEGPLSGRFAGFVTVGVPAGDAATGSHGRPIFGDLNGDGKQDLVTDGSYNQITVAQNFIQPLTLERIFVSPYRRVATLPWRRGIFFRAYGVYTDGSNIDLSGEVDWEVSDPALVLGKGGRMVALAPGDLTITATSGEMESTGNISIEMIPEGTEAGYPDVRFAPIFNDFGGVVWSVAHQSDSAVLAGGEFQQVEGMPAQNFARIRPDGSPDADFLANVGEIDGTVRKVLVLPDDRIYIAGSFTVVGSHESPKVARLHPNGMVDTSFQSGIASGSLQTAALQPDGKLLLGFYSGIERLLIDGSIDPSFNPISVGEVRALAVDDQGRILVGGSSLDALRRLFPSGSQDTSFDSSVITNVVNDVVIQSDGKIVCAGSKSGEFVVRLNEDGTADETFDQSTHPFWGVVEAVAVDARDQILVGHSFRPRRLLRDGSLDEDFDQDVSPDFAIQDMVVTAEGDLWIAGGRSAINGVGTMGIARIPLGGTDFSSWIGRHFSYPELHASELTWVTGSGPADRELLYYYAFEQEPANYPVSPFLPWPGEGSSMVLHVNPSAGDLLIELFHCEDLRAGAWIKFAARSSLGSWTELDPRFAVSEDEAGDVLIGTLAAESRTLFFRATARPE